MTKTLIGIPTYGNILFTQLCVNGIRETVTKPFDLFAVVGKPGDQETRDWLLSQGIPHTVHDENRGLACSVNDIYDQFEWYPRIVIIGNDVIPYPKSIDRLIDLAETSDWEWIAGSQFDAHGLCRLYPEARQHFSGGTLVFDFKGEPWKLHQPGGMADEIQPGAFCDVHNMCLFKRAVFEKIGYVDPNFYPAYFTDNDYVRRAVNAKIRGCTHRGSQFFHFWSRTIHQGSGGSNRHCFELNSQFYNLKWGGPFGQEPWLTPFDGHPHPLTTAINLPAGLKISRRTDEAAIVDHWRKQ